MPGPPNHDEPLDEPERALQARLFAIVGGAQHLNDVPADRVDAALADDRDTALRPSDRARLYDSEEAWLDAATGRRTDSGTMRPPSWDLVRVKKMTKIVSKSETYLKAGRVADLFALIQVLAFDKHAHRSEDGLAKELQEKPLSGTSWTALASEHPEFFRVSPTGTHRVSLVTRHVQDDIAGKARENAAEEARVGTTREPPNDSTIRGRGPLPGDYVQALLKAVLDIHDREAARASQWRSWLPFWGALLGSLLSLFGTYATYRFWKHESAATAAVVECHGTVVQNGDAQARPSTAIHPAQAQPNQPTPK